MENFVKIANVNLTDMENFVKIASVNSTDFVTKRDSYYTYNACFDARTDHIENGTN